jgi:hypothetical protein
MAKCAICHTVYTKWSMSQKVCGDIECARVQAKKVIKRIEERASRADRTKTRQRIESLQPRSYWIKRLKIYFHRYIRERDKALPCISCDRPLKENKFGGTVDAGHYRSVGSAKHMEFEEMNVHAQCKQCNRDLAGNHVEYRKGLVSRYNKELVEWIESNQQVVKLTIVDIKELIELYKRKWNDLQKG